MVIMRECILEGKCLKYCKNSICILCFTLFNFNYKFKLILFEYWIQVSEIAVCRTSVIRFQRIIDKLLINIQKMCKVCLPQWIWRMFTRFLWWLNFLLNVSNLCFSRGVIYLFILVKMASLAITNVEFICVVKH